jgi:accessory gene regulator B
MIDKLALKITTFICTEQYYNPKDRAKIQYALNIILGEGFKVIFLILLFNLIHRQNYFYFSLLVLMTIRTFTGGVHVKGAMNCLLLTILLFLPTCILFPLMPRFPLAVYLIISFFSLIILLLRAPICSVQRPIKDRKKRVQYKIIAIIMTLLWTIVLLFFNSPEYINCGFSTILLQNIQLLLVKKPAY